VPDKFESQPQTFFEQVHAGYQRRVLEYPGRFARIDAAQTRDTVWAAVREAVAGRGWL
jgi:dTMP kinase